MRKYTRLIVAAFVSCVAALPALAAERALPARNAPALKVLTTDEPGNSAIVIRESTAPYMIAPLDPSQLPNRGAMRPIPTRWRVDFELIPTRWQVATIFVPGVAVPAPANEKSPALVENPSD